MPIAIVTVIPGQAQVPRRALRAQRAVPHVAVQTLVHVDKVQAVGIFGSAEDLRAVGRDVGDDETGLVDALAATCRGRGCEGNCRCGCLALGGLVVLLAAAEEVDAEKFPKPVARVCRVVETAVEVTLVNAVPSSVSARPVGRDLSRHGALSLQPQLHTLAVEVWVKACSSKTLLEQRDVAAYASTPDAVLKE